MGLDNDNPTGEELTRELSRRKASAKKADQGIPKSVQRFLALQESSPRRGHQRSLNKEQTQVFLGIDVGTSSTKCLAVDEHGRTLALAQRAYPMSHPRAGWAEQDAEDYWSAVVETVNRCVQELGGREISALAMSTQGDTLILCDADGNPLAPAISWMDTRPEADCAELLKERDQEFWYRQTGITLTSYSSACKIRWVEKNEPALYKKVARFCSVPDFITWRLCGEFAADVPGASWDAVFSPADRKWSEPVMEVLGLTSDRFPRAVESGEVIGTLLPDAAAALHLSPDTKVIAGAFDQAAAAHGAGARSGERSVLSCGTAWVLYSVASQPVLDPLCRVPICCHTNASEWGMVLPFPGGANYDWLSRTFPDGDDKPSGSEPPVFIPHLYGGVCPDWREDSKGSLVGLTMAHTREDVRLALMRGMAFEARRNFEVAEELSGEIKSVRMVGGAGKSEIWPQMISNVLNRPIEVSDLLESACYGAAKLAAGAISDTWTGAESVRRCDPQPDQVSFEERQYLRYLRFYEALLPQYALDSRSGRE